MKRMQVLLEPETIQAVKRIAKRQNTSASSYVREAVKQKIQKEKKEVNATAVLLEAAKNAFSSKDAPRDLSTNDEYLYGKDSVL